MFAKHLRFAEQFRNRPEHGLDFVPAHKGIQSGGEVGIGGKPAADPQREAHLRVAADRPFGRSQTDVVDLRIRAPHTASGDRDLEFARQVVELWVAREDARGPKREWRGIADFVPVNACDRAAGDVSGDIAAGGQSIQAASPECSQDFGQAFDGYPMQLDVLANRDVGNSARKTAGKARDGSELVRGEQAVRNPDTNHEARHRLPFPAFAPDYAGSVALRVDAPPAEVRAQPFRRDGIESVARETANLLEAFPGILLPLQALDSLRFRFLVSFSHKKEKPIASFLWRWVWNMPMLRNF